MTNLLDILLGAALTAVLSVTGWLGARLYGKLDQLEKAFNTHVIDDAKTASEVIQLGPQIDKLETKIDKIIEREIDRA